MDCHLRRPLLPTSAAAKPINSLDSNIILRLVLVAAVGLLSAWANHEASKGFEIVLENDLPTSSAGRRFHLLYVANDGATRLVLHASKFVETLLYPNSTQPKKQVRRVTVRLAVRNLTHPVVVDSSGDHFVLHLSPSIMEEDKSNHAMLMAVFQGMARVWLYDVVSAPKPLVNGMVECITALAGLSTAAHYGGGLRPECWNDEDAGAVAHFLNYCEGQRRGFIQRLNQGMGGGWNDRTVDDALGMPAQHLCALYVSHHIKTTSLTDRSMRAH